MKTKLLFILLVFASLKLASQSTKTRIYLDKDNNLIPMVEYVQKCNSFLYKCSQKENDSLLINTAFLQFQFGKLSIKENSQLRKYLAKKMNNKNLLNAAIIINHKKELLGFHKIPVNDTLTHGRFPTTEEQFNLRNLNIDNYKKKCSALMSSNNAITLNTYIKNSEYTFNNKSYNWYKVNMLASIFKNKSGVLILKPDGEYFLNQGFMLNDYAKTLLSNYDWKQHINHYKNALSNYLKKRTSFYKFERKRQSSVIFINKKDFRNKNQISQLKESLRSQGKGNIVIRDRSEMNSYRNEMVAEISNYCYSKSY